jgi:hypothetical protein
VDLPGRRRRHLGALSALLSHFFGLELLITPLVAGSILSVTLAQINRLWHLDRLLVHTLFNSSANAADDRPAADKRLLSGLKLLNTFLPLNEAIVLKSASRIRLKLWRGSREDARVTRHEPQFRLARGRETVRASRGHRQAGSGE